MACCLNLDHFCYVCGHIVPKVANQARKNYMTDEFRAAYLAYFSDQVDLTQEMFTPNTVCQNCYTRLLNWENDRARHLPYQTPVIWLYDADGHDESR